MTFVDSFQEKIWKDKYQYADETYEGFCNRIAYSIFAKDEFKAAQLKESIMAFRTLFGGRINSNIGVKEQGLTLFNCFIEATVKAPDSLEGIMDMVTKYALTLKTEGGVGFCANFLRPTNTIIKKIGVTTPGAIKFLEIFDKVSEVITSGSVSKEDSVQGIPTKKSIRKGATMVTMNVNHPDIEEFITAKAVPNKLTKMNMSVLITDAFMYAVENDLDWNLWFPDINFERYDELWNGDFEKWAEKGYPCVTYRTVKANYLWELLLKSSFTRNEPGILFIDTARSKDNLGYLKDCSILSTNPCQPSWATVLTPIGIKTFKDIVIGSELWSEDGWVKVTNKQPTGVKDVYKYRTNSNVFYGTKNHRVVSEGVKTIVEEAVTIDTLEGANVNNLGFQSQVIMDGLVLGDGSVHKESNNLIYLCIGEADKDYFKSEIEPYIIKHRSAALGEYAWEIGTTLSYDEVPLTYQRSVPDRYLYGDIKTVSSFLRGLFSANGTVISTNKTKMVRLKSSSSKLVEGVQIMLSSLGIRSYITTNKPTKVKHSNGTYESRTSYDINITKHTVQFERIIGFIQKYKQEKLKEINERVLSNREKIAFDINEIEYVSTEEVFDITVSGDSHTYWTGGCNVSNCAEIFGNTGIVEYKGVLYELGDVCNLGSLVLPRYYDMDTEKFDEELFKKDATLMVEALDNVIEISDYPLDMYEMASKLKRKIGIGLAGVGSLFMMMGVRYGSDESIKILDNLLSIFMNTVYQASALLAKEKGPFELYSEELLQGGYVANNDVLTGETIDLIRKYGIRNSALSAIAPNGCLVDNVLVPTSKGCFRIDNFNTLAGTDSTKLASDFEDSYFSAWYDKGYADTVKITSRHGYSIEGTYDHKVRVITDSGGYMWKSLDTITKGDLILLKKDFLFDKETWVRKDIAELIGLYMADGWHCGNRLYFQVHKDEVPYIKSLIESCFKHKFTRIIERPRSDKNSIRIEVNSKKIRDWFDKHNCVKDGAVNVFIPDIIMASNREVILSFIRGYFFGDGGFNKSKQNMKFTSVSEKIISQLQIMLLGLGVLSNKYTEITAGKEIVILDKITKSNFDVCRLELNVYNSRLLCSLLGIDCSIIDKKYEGRNFESVLLLPDEVNIFNKGNYTKPYKESNVICVTDHTYKSKITKEYYNWFVKNNFALDFIADISYGKTKKHVQDISVSNESHTYVANGFVTHNTLSILAGNVSGGLEPVFSPEFTRWNRIEGKKLDFRYPKIHKGEWFETDYFKEELIADEAILVSTDGKYRIDKNQGLCKEVTIRDYGYGKALEYGKTEHTTAMELSIQEHFNILKTVTSNIDQSASKTINLPADIPFEDFKALYGKIHSQGIKGCTTYRAGTSIAVLETKKEEKTKTIKKQQKEFLDAFKGHESGEIMYDVVKLPEEFPSKSYIIKASSAKWYVTVGFKNKEMTKPFCIFINTNSPSATPITMDAINKLKVLAEFAGLGGEKLAEVERKFSNQKNSVKIARMLGFMLRHNLSVVSIVKALDKVEGAHPGTFVFRIKKFLMQFITEPVTDLDMVCPSCGSKNITLQEGCILCLSCGSSLCS